VSSRFGVNWGQQGGNALWSVQYRFQGETAHSAGSPWRGRSALDAVMLMAQAWEFKREHLRPAARSHYIIVEGGDQPNVVPQFATIWFYFRERDYELTKEQFDAAALMAEGAALMTGTTIDTIMTVGSAWSRHFSKPVAEASFANIQAVGMPEWSEDDIRFAEAFQAEMEVEVTGLQTEVPEEMSGPVDLSRSLGGGSDDIGDISWNMPTVTLGFPSNMSGGPGHNWANGIAMATPIAHKGGVAGAKVQARTLLDLFLDGETVEAAWDYFNDVQIVDTEYIPMIAPTDQPAIFLNEGIMAQWRERMRPFYYDATRFDTYLEQLGIEYPTIRTRPISEDGAAEPEGRGPGGS
jgi:aminobenzoyl-glutamate utilization protein B